MLLGQFLSERHPNNDKTAANLVQHRSQVCHQPLPFETVAHTLLDFGVHRSEEIAAHLSFLRE
jgi:hypothetical protein